MLNIENILEMPVCFLNYVTFEISDIIRKQSMVRKVNVELGSFS